MTERDAKRNIWLMRTFRFLGGCMFAIPIMVLFWQDNGLNQQQIAWTQTFFAVTTVVVEMPTGWLADRFKRKYSIVAGAVFSTAGFALLQIASKI